MKRSRLVILLLVVLAASCSPARVLSDGEYVLQKNKIEVNDKHFRSGKLSNYLRQKANSTGLFGISAAQGVYNMAGKKETKFANFLRKIGTPPVVYDPNLVDASIDNLKNHLKYLGYYGSDIDSRIRVKKRNVRVTYFVTLGKQFKISSLSFDIPDSLQADFEADRKHITVKPGDWLSESSLEAESERSSGYFRTVGYYDLTKSNYFFEADTLTVPGVAALRMSIRGDNLRKFHLDSVRISYPDRIKLRPRMLAGINTLRPGDLYNERAVNTTYSRFSSVNLLNGVNIALSPVGDDKVNCDINLSHSRLQGFKANLEISTNSSALIGISPQISYFHKNIFHGGELLNLSFMGNFQFKPKSNVRATEFGATASIRFPGFVGIPNRKYKGDNLPRTEVAASFNYQDRPEFKRTMISTTYGYIGSAGKQFYYQVYPAKLNIVRIFNLDPDFTQRLGTNPFLWNIYSDHFDLGLGGIFYYTTNSDINPKTSYHYIRLSTDLSGNLLSAFNKVMKTSEGGYHLIWGVPYSQYFRAEMQAGKTFVFGRRDGHAIALRLAGGVGLAYGNSLALPFEKAFYVGGSSSLRGWQVRTLGPGCSQPDEAFTIPSQVGDWKLEANLEYRFKIYWKIEGATFIDAGNIWSLYKDAPEEERFSWKSIAMDWGIGLRLNLDFIIVRVDYGLQIHDPATLDFQNGWLGPKQWFRKGNYALHFGVGYPF